MKINNEDLKNLYKSFIAGQISKGKEICLDSEEIIEFFFKKTSKRKKSKIINHVTHCFLCFLEFERIYDIFKHSKEFENEIIQKLLKNKSTKQEKQSLSFFKSLRKLSPLYVGVVFLMLFFSIVFFIRHNKDKKYRELSSHNISLIAPLGVQYSDIPLVFRWSKLDNSEYYILELFDDSLLPIWKSGKIKVNSYPLPRKIVESLIYEKTYFWMVTAYLPGNEKMESLLENFYLKARNK